MNFFILLMIISATLANFYLLEKLAPLSSFLQNQCGKYTSEFLQHQESLNALVCGTSVNNLLIKELFIQTDLYHLLIVSGGHLQILSFFWDSMSEKLPRSFQPLAGVLKWLLLISYSLTAGFEPPLQRALLAEALRSLSRFFKWGWSGWRIHFGATVFLLCLSPRLFSSWSFYLSCLASLGFLVPTPDRWSSLQKHFVACFSIALLIAIPFGYQGPLGLLMNFIMGNVLALVLFPLALLTKICAVFGLSIGVLFDGLFNLTLEVLKWSETLGLRLAGRRSFPPLTAVLWIVLVTLQLFFFFIRSSLYRRNLI